MSYILPISCLEICLLNDIHLWTIPNPKNKQGFLNYMFQTLAQFFITTNVIVIFEKNMRKTYVYCKKSFRRSKKNINNRGSSTYATDYLYVYNIPSNYNIYKFAEHKLNYSRIFKDIKYQKYINYLFVIINIVKKLFNTN